MNREEYDGMSKEDQEQYISSEWKKTAVQLHESYAKFLAEQSTELLAKEQKEKGYET
jgi:hypothetical protein